MEVTDLPISFMSFFRTAPPTIILKPDVPVFTIVTANDAYLAATNAKLEDIVGSGFLDAFPENPLDPQTRNVEALRGSLTEAVLTKKQHVLPSQKYDIPIWGTDLFNVHYWKATNSPILNEQGEVEYIVHVTLDITSAVEAAQKERGAFEVAEAQRQTMEQMEERLRLAMDSANMGMWHIDLKTGKLSCSQRFKEIYGFHRHDTVTLDEVLSTVKDDYQAAVRSAISATISRNEPFDIEFPILPPGDKKLRWVKATGKIYKQQADGSSSFSGTVIDVTEKKSDEIRKNDFIAMVSHELKTPLTSVKAYVQMLASNAAKTEDSFSTVVLKKVHSQVDKMHTLIKSFLDVARLQDGKIGLNLRIFQLSELLKQAVKDIELLTHTHELVLDLCDSIEVNADKDKLIQVVSNFLSNAIKYSSSGSRIEISCERRNGEAVVCVKDEGIGIKQADLNRLFERFFRVEDAETKLVSGFGLGLYLCAEIIERHNGKIWVESQPGKGSAFYFSLPLAAEDE